jgi:hypothetical protein
MIDVMQRNRPRLELTGKDGNAFAILGRAHRAARQAGMPEEQWKAIMKEATASDYDHLLQTMLKNFDCDPLDEEGDDGQG